MAYVCAVCRMGIILCPFALTELLFMTTNLVVQEEQPVECVCVGITGW